MRLMTRKLAIIATLMLALALAGCASHPRKLVLADVVREAQRHAEAMTPADAEEILAVEDAFAWMRAHPERCADDRPGVSVAGCPASLYRTLTAAHHSPAYSGDLTPVLCGLILSYTPEEAGAAIRGPRPPDRPGDGGVTLKEWQGKGQTEAEVWREKAGLCKQVVIGWWPAQRAAIPECQGCRSGLECGDFADKLDGPRPPEIAVLWRKAAADRCMEKLP